MTNLRIGEPTQTEEKGIYLGDLEDGTWFTFKNFVYIVNRVEGTIAFSICGSAILKEDQYGLLIKPSDIWETAEVIRN